MPVCRRQAARDLAEDRTERRLAIDDDVGSDDVFRARRHDEKETGDDRGKRR